MDGSVVRWHVLLPEGHVEGVLLPADEDQDLTVDDPTEVRAIVETALRDLDDLTREPDAHAGRGTLVVTGQGENVLVKILHRENGPRTGDADVHPRRGHCDVG